MRKWVCIFLIILFLVPSRTFGEDRSLLYGVLGLEAIDWMQTRYISRNPDKFKERNPILGSRPSKSKVDAYFATVMLMTTILYELSSKEARDIIIITIGATELGSIGFNLTTGIRF
jgi:hypothetical protein